MYQMDAQHTGRSPHSGPRQVRLLSTFDTSEVEVPDPVFGTSDIQSSAAIGPDGTAYIGLHSGLVFALHDPVGEVHEISKETASQAAESREAKQAADERR